MRALLLAPLLLAACGGADPGVHAATDAGASDARIPFYDHSCEPDQVVLDACLATAGDCSASSTTFAGDSECTIALSSCRLEEVTSHRACFEGFDCQAALAQLDCGARCESTFADCVRAAANPGARDACGQRAANCWQDQCGGARWRSWVAGEPPCH